MAIVRLILRAHLPVLADVRVFGSRATGRAHRGSDLDLLVDAGRTLTREEASALAAAFDESDLPYEVDLVDRHAIPADFSAMLETAPTISLRLD